MGVNFMKNNEKGISLIVLVITIIVIIILAGAVILSLSANNPIVQATTAKNNSNVVTVQSAVTLYLGKLMATGQGAAVVTGTAINQAAASSATVVAGTQSGVICFDNLGLTKPAGTWTVDANGKVSATAQ
jgi:competence protein ComGC